MHLHPRAPSGPHSTEGRTLETKNAGESRLPRKRVLFAGLVWMAVLGTGFFCLAKEEFTPVTGAVSDADFPSGSAIALAPDLPTLILFAHPYCPCTRASLHELDELLASVQHRVAVNIVFTIPKDLPPGWAQGELWQMAAAVPNARIITDQNGSEATRFKVKGSGHVLLYAPSGHLMFSGGITPSRGHEGDNPGRSAILSLVLEGHSAVSRTPVFGCPLLEAPSCARQ